jgi:hypothetical protein
MPAKSRRRVLSQSAIDVVTTTPKIDLRRQKTRGQVKKSRLQFQVPLHEYLRSWQFQHFSTAGGLVDSQGWPVGHANPGLRCCTVRGSVVGAGEHFGLRRRDICTLRRHR